MKEEAGEGDKEEVDEEGEREEVDEDDEVGEALPALSLGVGEVKEAGTVSAPESKLRRTSAVGG